jgi:hypothetical protein
VSRIEPSRSDKGKKEKSSGGRILKQSIKEVDGNL